MAGVQAASSGSGIDIAPRTGEHSGMIMISTPLNGNNWLSWSRSERIALEGRDKLGFIDGTCSRPVDGYVDLKQWKITNSMVRTWILNTISKDIVNAYLYSPSARALWLELEMRYGECDGPLLYRIQREIGSMTQGNLSVTTYYTNMKQLWDELISLKPPRLCTCGCTCGSNQAKIEEIEASQLIQFLTGLNESYDNIRNQILVLDPLPHVNKAFSMVLRVERQRQVNMGSVDTGDTSALLGRKSDYRGATGYKPNIKIKGQIDKWNLICEHCNKSGHGKNTCFKLYGVPDWYKELSDQKRRTGNGGRAYATSEMTSVRGGSVDTSVINTRGNLVTELMEALKMIQAKTPQDPVHVHFAQGDEMAGISLNTNRDTSNLGTWIVDTGATNHMCGDIVAFHSLNTLITPITITLPDNSVTQATQSGTIHLSVSLVLKNVLLVPSFKFNLLSVSQLCRFNSVCFLFLTSKCILQDLKTKHVLAIGKQVGRLYYLDRNSFVSIPISHCNASHIACSSSSSMYTLWHQRLGHPNLSVLSHISVLQLNDINKDTAKGKVEWENTVAEELNALEQNHTWDLVDLPNGQRAIGCKWVFKVKLKPDGSVDRYKARLVAKGYNQVEGVDYIDCFSPVAKAVTVRTLLTVASGFAWPIHQIDINNAFLHGFLDEDIYMLPPEGSSIPAGKVCKLRRSLYGLKQASRQWNQELTSKLLGYGFIQSPHEHCLFIKHFASNILVLLVYVDDVLVTGTSESQIIDIKHFLDKEVTIKVMGCAKYFLGLELQHSDTGLAVSQYKYTRDIFSDAGLSSCKPTNTPLPLGIKLSTQSTPLPDTAPYRRLVGRLLYLSLTRPDIAFGAQQLSQFVHRPGQDHMDAALHLVKYLKGNPQQGLFFPRSNSFHLTAFCDADWAGCVDTRRSLTGYCIFLGDALISWKCKKQTTVARSTAEEYRSLGTIVCELKWITFLLRDLHISPPTPIPVYCDNQAAIHIVANPVFHERTKHIEIDCHLVRDHYKSGFVYPLTFPASFSLPISLPSNC
ncbi:UNVERIFIED_CONTAM: Retrovirus-related Pol polyprotein from transposon RE1 [Sesamum latifolium]|uniref:Retrovirus-related Pol polyprotein from transposon RE1 n=1 Tax=Sesamum latifolium TaxID=2727402 RepID=A0AAW2SST7_9LAMI